MRIDITEGIPKQAHIYFCKTCERYLVPPAQWLKAELESRELLALCLKKLKGLTKVRLIDAGFVWTEPHSRRLKIKLTIQKEVFQNTILQQVFIVEYIVNTQQCEDCRRIMAQQTWKAVIQVRQKVQHKKTFLYLEQLILKHNAHRDTVNIKETSNGLDFFYTAKNQGAKLVDFLQAVVPTRSKTSEQLISADYQSNTANLRHTYSVEIVPICKEDLICLPSKLATSLGCVNQLQLCSHVTNTLHLLDPFTLHTCDLTASVYWRQPFDSLCSHRDLLAFIVLDVNPLHVPHDNKHTLADVQLAKISDFGTNDITYYTRTHLGHLIKSGDTVLGYELATTNLNDRHFDNMSRRAIADVILVKKSYPERKKTKKRPWMLKHLDKEHEESSTNRRVSTDRDHQDYESFLRDLEENPDMRQRINLYKRSKTMLTETNLPSEIDSSNEDYPDVPIEELLDDLQLDDDDSTSSSIPAPEDGMFEDGI